MRNPYTQPKPIPGRCMVCNSLLDEGRKLVCSRDCCEQWYGARATNTLDKLDGATTSSEIGRAKLRSKALKTCQECGKRFFGHLRQGFCSITCTKVEVNRIIERNAPLLTKKQTRHKCLACGKLTFDAFCDRICELMYNQGIRYDT